MIPVKKFLPLIAGAALGYAYWHFIGCSSGHCPLTSTWYISTGYGALVGASFLLPGRPARREGATRNTSAGEHNDSQ